MIVPAVCGAFLLAVLWFDLMFDVQALGGAGSVLPPEALASIAAYYRRVTTDAVPMPYLVGTVMLVGVVATAVRVAREPARRRMNALSFVLFASPVTLAFRIFPKARALGAEAAPIEVQSAMARAILHDHLLCLAAMAAFLVLELGRRPRAPR